MRRAAKIDRNQPAIVAALRAIGCTVQSLAAVGTGVPDLLVGYRGRTYLMEIKDGLRAPSERRLTPLEAQWLERWRGRPVAVVETVEQALEVVQADIYGDGWAA